MASIVQKNQARELCKKFLTFYKKGGLYKGSIAVFLNHRKRRQLTREWKNGSKLSKEEINLWKN